MSERILTVVPLFIDVEDVMRSMKCSRSRAYEHMRAALGRQPGERGQSRVPVYVWERYVRQRFDPEARSAGVEQARTDRRAETTRVGLRITRPRTKPRLARPPGEPAVLQSPRVSDEPSTC